MILEMAVISYDKKIDIRLSASQSHKDDDSLTSLFIFTVTYHCRSAAQSISPATPGLQVWRELQVYQALLNKKYTKKKTRDAFTSDKCSWVDNTTEIDMEKTLEATRVLHRIGYRTHDSYTSK